MFWCFQYPPWYLAKVPIICPMSLDKGKYRTEAMLFTKKSIYMFNGDQDPKTGEFGFIENCW